jgi:2-hydroxy-3-keto-5-methylthiopentenyl-1-phosphate phosphatase
VTTLRWRTMSPARLSVFLDFDGTITKADTGVHLLERLAPARWHDIEALYDSGDIGSRECIQLQWALIRSERPEIEAVAREVAIDEGFERLVKSLRSVGAEVTILSDGFGLRVEEVAEMVGVRAVTNRVDWRSGSVTFPNGDPSCECAGCGVCKRAPIREAKRRGRTTVLVGDGISDEKAASVADVVFAKGDLAEWCEREGLPFVRFTSLVDVHDHMSNW